MKLKKILASILCIAMVVGTMNFTVLADVPEPTAPQIDIVSIMDNRQSTENWIDNADTTWFNATNTSYVINSAAELAGLAKLVNEGTSFKNKTVTLGADIDLKEVDWTPIGGGASGKYFTGTFDGNNHKISNLWVASSNSSIGLFGYIGATETGLATIKNLIVENATVVNASADGVAVVVGFSGADGRVENVTVKGKLNIQGYRGVAGIVGKGYADIYNSTVEAEGTIASKFWCAGGIIGHSDEPCVTIEKCKVIGIGDGLTIDGGSYNGAGGIGGYVADGSTVRECLVQNIAIDGDSYYYGGYLCGNGKTAENSTVINAKFLVAGTPSNEAHDAASVTTAVAEVDGVYYEDIQSALKAIKENSVFNLLTDVIVDYDWDRRYTGATITVPATINGNGKTIKFTGKISEGQNYHAAFRTEADVVFENLTIDMSEATSANSTRMRAISSKLGVTIKNCTFIGNTEYTNTRAVIYGEGGGSAISDVVVSIADSTFTNWTKGFSDNENGQDAKNVIVSGNTFTNADVYVSAYETAEFTNNTLNNSWADIRSYTTDNELDVVATGNTLTENTDTKQNFIKAGGNVEAQEGFMLPPPPALPSATVTEPVINTTVMAMNGLSGEAFETPVTFKMNFKADDPTDVQKTYYGDWIADYELTVNKDITGKDAYLVGQYDFYNENWVKLAEDTENVVINKNQSIKVISDLMPLSLTYDFILENVKDFDCGIYLTPEFIEANPDLKITLALKLYNPQNEEESYVIGKAYEFTAADALPQAQIGETTYQTLAAAFEAAQDGDTVKVLKDISLNEMIVNAKKINLDLNGKTITGTDNTEKNFSLIDNRGDLTITGNGKMTLTSTVNSGWNRYSAVLANNPGGKLVIENGTFEHLGGTDMAYGIDNLTNGKDTYAETVINGGTIKSPYRGIRQFLNGVEAQNILTINGGTVEGANKSIWMQDPSKNANSGKLTVTEGATLNGDVYLSVTEGSTEWPVEVSIAASAVNGDVTSKNVPEGYEFAVSNGVWNVKEIQAETISWNSKINLLIKMGRVNLIGTKDSYGRLRAFAGIDDPSQYDDYGFIYKAVKGDVTREDTISTKDQGQIYPLVRYFDNDKNDFGVFEPADFGEGNVHVTEAAICLESSWITSDTMITITPFVKKGDEVKYGQTTGAVPANVFFE